MYNYTNKCIKVDGTPCRRVDGLTLRTGYCWQHQWQKPLVYTQLTLLPDTTYVMVNGTLMYKPLPQATRMTGLAWINTIRATKEMSK